jgi:hypothetical protein
MYFDDMTLVELDTYNSSLLTFLQKRVLDCVYFFVISYHRSLLIVVHLVASWPLVGVLVNPSHNIFGVHFLKQALTGIVDLRPQATYTKFCIHSTQKPN